MTIRQIEILVAAAEEPTLEKASAKLFLTEAAVSKAIMEVQKQYNIVIFKRAHGTLTLTPDGVKVINDCKKVLSRYRKLRDNMITNTGKRTVRIAFPDAFSDRLVGEIAAELTEKFGDAEFWFSHGNSRYADGDLDKGAVDIAVTEFGDYTRKCSVFAGVNRYCFVYNRDTEVDRESSFEELLSNHKICIGRYGTISRRLFDSHAPHFSATPIPPYFSSTSFYSMVVMTKSTESLALVPYELCERIIRSLDLDYLMLPKEFESPFIISYFSSDAEKYADIIGYLTEKLGPPAEVGTEIAKLFR